MTSYVFMCPPTPGHLNPMMGLAKELKTRGHTITFVGVLDIQAAITSAGFNFCSIGERELPIGTVQKRVQELGRQKGLQALRTTIKIFRESARNILNHAPAAIRSAKAEFLIIDQATFAGSTVAEHLGIPFATICCALILNQEPLVPPVNTSWRYLNNPTSMARSALGNAILALLSIPITLEIARFRRRVGLRFEFSRNSSFSELLQISQQCPDFEFPRKSLPKCFHFVGPLTDLNKTTSSDDFPYYKLGSKPIIYASMGTIQNRRSDVFQIIAKACERLDVQLVISLGSMEQEIPELPGDPIVVEYAPQIELIKRSAAVITHAGLNTVLESLTFGVPMVTIPITNDQPGVAARVAWTGTGITLELKTLTASKLREAVKEIMKNPQYREKAEHIGRQLASLGGSSRAADLIEAASKN